MIELNCNYIGFFYNNYIAKFFFAPRNIYLKEMEKLSFIIIILLLLEDEEAEIDCNKI